MSQSIEKKLSFKEAKSLLRKAKAAYKEEAAFWDVYISTIPAEGLILQGQIFNDGYRAVWVSLASNKEVREVTQTRGLDATDLGASLNTANERRVRQGLPAFF